MTYSVSVVVPIYNVEPYFERCLHSLFGQTLEDIEYIFVNDASTDSSMEIFERVLKEYPHRTRQVKVINLDENKGIAATRTRGIIESTGEYIIHCDSDDFVDIDMYRKLYQKAKEDDVDIVYCDFYEVKKNIKERKGDYLFDETPKNLLANKYKHRRPNGSLWNMLVRGSLIRDHNIVPFKGGDYAEDLGCQVRILFYANTISYLKEPLYYYNKRDFSLSYEEDSLLTLRRWEMRKIVIDGIEQFLKDYKEFKTTVKVIKLYAKLHYFKAFSDKREWFDLYKESHGAIWKIHSNSLKSNIIWWIMLQHYNVMRVVRYCYRIFKGKEL